MKGKRVVQITITANVELEYADMDNAPSYSDQFAALLPTGEATREAVITSLNSLTMAGEVSYAIDLGPITEVPDETE